MNLRTIREVNTGFGEGLVSAFELVVTPMIFGFLGHLLDQKLGTGALFMLAMSIFVLSYCIWKLIAKYNAEMARHEANAPWNRHKLVAAQKKAQADA